MAARIVAPEARDDLRLIAAGHNPSTALTILGHVKRSFLLLGRHPFIGRARDGDLGPGLRSLPSGGHVIIYRASPKAIAILRVVDGRRDYPRLFLT